MAGKTYSGTYTTTILLTNPGTQNPVTLTGAITVNGTNAASDSGIYSNAAYAWNITNLGRIASHGFISYGIALLHGGTITNGAAGGTLGSILSDETGIFITGAPASVTNNGSIVGTAGRGVFLQAGGTLANAAGALIQGGFEGVAIYNAGGLLTNAGTILDTATTGLGVELYAGSVTNQAGATIGGAYGVGFVAHATAGTLTNAGTIDGTTRDGVELTDGGTVTNTGGIVAGIAAILALYGTASVTNAGSIGGTYAGVDLLAGGSVHNQTAGRITGAFGITIGDGTIAAGAIAPIGSVINNGRITASTYQGVSFDAGGTLANTGSIFGPDAGFAAFYGAATLTNSGSIGGFDGVSLAQGGTITNQAGGTIAGTTGIVLQNGPISGTAAPLSSLVNAGTISGSGSFGVALLANTSLINQAGGTIAGGAYGLYIKSVAGTIANYGVITGQSGVYGREVVANSHVYPGQLTIINAGTITGTGGIAVGMFASNDLLKVLPGAVFNGQVIGGGARLELEAGGAGSFGTLANALSSFSTITEDAGAVWNAGGYIASSATLIDNGTLLVGPGALLDNLGTTTGAGTIALSSSSFASSGTLQAGVTIAFRDPYGLFACSTPLGTAATIAGFSAGDRIWLTNIALSGLTDSYSGTTTAGTLTLTQSSVTVGRFAFLGNYKTASFAFKADVSGGTDISIPCFLAGTHIATEAGLVRVERLRPGMRALTAAGRLREITWIGHRALTLADHPEPAKLRPIRIAPHAFGPGLPSRALYLSPDHAVFWQGALIPVHLLCNGTSLRPEPRPRVRYFHVELDRHDILLAEALPVESFFEDTSFTLHGPARPTQTARRQRCAPLILAGGALARTRRHLLARLLAPLAPQPAQTPTILVNGAPQPSVRAAPGRLLFRLPPLAEHVHFETACRPTQLFLDGVALPPPDASGALRLGHPRTTPRSLEVRLHPAAHLPSIAAVASAAGAE